MAQLPTEQNSANFYHPHTHPHPHPHTHPHPHAHGHPHQHSQTHAHPHSHSHPHAQLPLPPQFRNPFDLIFDERTGALNYNYIRPYITNQLQKSQADELSESLIIRRPRRTRTTFTSAQISELEQHFLQSRYLTSSRLAELSSKLALGTAQVKIWFKNRRRRHKIQTDQQKDHAGSFATDSVSLSPGCGAARVGAGNVKVEQHSGAVPMKSESQTNSNAPGPPSLHTLSLSSSGNTTPATLTPSPTPTTPTPSYIDHFGDTCNQYHQYHYNNAHGTHHQGAPVAPPTLTHLHAPPGSHYPSKIASATSAVVSQFFAQPMPPQPTPLLPPQSLAMQRQQQQRHHNQQSHQHQAQYNSHQSQHQHHQFDFQQKTMQNTAGDGSIGVTIKDDPDFNFNSSCFLRSATTATLTARNAAVAADVYEPLTPKNDDSPGACSGSQPSAADDLNETNKKTLQQLLLSANASVSGDTCANRNGFGNPSFSGNNILEDCNGVFSKYNKFLCEPHQHQNHTSQHHHETNYQCTMDTIMQAYSNHRTSSGNTQFAYCFN